MLSISRSVVQSLKPFGPLMFVENIDGPVAHADAFLHEGQHQAILVIAAIEERADMATAIHRRPPDLRFCFARHVLPSGTPGVARGAVALFVLFCRAEVPCRLETVQTTVTLLSILNRYNRTPLSFG
jgi:hypothetical protein